MKHQEIRDNFLSFFKKRDHTIVKSSSLIPNDPTMLLTGAGMVQFKPIFLGNQKADYNRAASAQKCVRTTDIDNVGKTARHLTFFEMLGNFSFGDYFKEKAIPWCWELLVDEYKLDPEKLWITIYNDDDEAAEIWQNEAGISSNKIVRLGEDDNFWAAGPTGPCGPCSEIIFDFGKERACSSNCSVGCDCDRFLEVWNLVFMQYDRDENGKLNPLPKKGIDTGMGLERLASLLQNSNTNFETDIIWPLIENLVELSGQEYEKEDKYKTSMRIIADHSRAITFLIGDGVIPTNDGRGYILRRLLRRTIRHGKIIGVDKPFLKTMVETVMESMGSVYPEIIENKDFILKIVQSEEERFNQTLRQGLRLIEKNISELAKENKKELSGETAFKLYDTYGFPLELTEEIASESGLKIKKEEYEKLMEKQRKTGRSAWQESGWEVKEKLYSDLAKKLPKSEFSGYEEEETQTKIYAIIKNGKLCDQLKKNDEGEIVLEKTPFYAEKGGQIADKGLIKTESGEFEVLDTQEQIEGLILHMGRVTKGSIEKTNSAKAIIEIRRRQLIARNHTATHLLHWALRLVLGSHVKQAGSFVGHDHLRFDFSHFQAMNDDEIKKVENLVNQKIIENHPVRCFITTQDYARDIGAIALFGEKYDEYVRVVESGNFHKELCGGTHVVSTGVIGLFKISSETSIGSNLRRIEAVTSRKAIEIINDKENIIKKIESRLETNLEQIPEKIDSLVDELKDTKQKISKMQSKQIKDDLSKLLKDIVEINGYKVVVAKIDASDMEELRYYTDLIRDETKSCVVLLGSITNGKVLLIAAATKDIAGKGFSSKELIQNVAPLVGGGGGGKNDLAQAGGRKIEKIDEALSKGKEYIIEFFTGDDN